MPSFASSFGLLLGAGIVAFATTASAQTLPSIDARTWKPSTDPNASMVIEPAVTPGPGQFAFGAWAHYDHQPIILRKQGTDDIAYRPVSNLLGLDLTGNLGIGQRLAIGAAIPLVLYQDGSSGLPKTISDVDKTPTTAIGDVGLTLKGALIRNEGGGLGLAALGYFSIPTGDRASFVGDGSMTVQAKMLAEYTLLVAVAQASVGYKVRTDHHTWPDSSLGGYRFGDEIPWSLGLAVKPGVFGVDSGNRQRWELAMHGWFPAGPVGPFGTGDPGSAALSPVMLTASDRIELGHYKDTFLLVGGDFALSQAVGAPVFRGVVSFGWAPHDHDMDHDGVKDDVDGCPEIPEDKDGFEDADGCPEIDNDDDGIIDKEDACPNVKGVESKDPKKNGCPIQDADGDGIDDAVDACPKDKGPASSDPARNGCPVNDQDGDGIPDNVDKCPTQAEDKDGFQDADGCPDPDNDGDGVTDKDDACPNEKGEPSTDPSRNGCPNADRDGDTYDNDSDKCPDTAEVFNGVDDGDGCPDEGGKPLATINEKLEVRVATPIKLTGAPGSYGIEPASMVTLRALALELNRHRNWTLAVGVKPNPGPDSNATQMDSLERSFEVVRILSLLSHRDGVAESVSWDAVKGKPGADSGMAFMVLVTP